jgi:predicted acyl esterase
MTFTTPSPSRRAAPRRQLTVALVVLGGALAGVPAPAGAHHQAPGAAPFAVRPSVYQVSVTGAVPGDELTLTRRDRRVAAARADALGSHLFRNVPAGDGYRVTVTHDGQAERSEPVRVLDARHPKPSFYRSQRLEVSNLGPTAGYGYLTVRDGTTLSAQVSLPGPPGDGPYPTVVEYSGYDPSNPGTGQPQFKLFANALGYAWVGVNIRGTGCSGGSFTFFERLQGLDGYDVIETVAAQPWSTGRIGMVGISYPGISQLFVARTRPPHLAAITPLSVIDDTYAGILYPGGIFNDGFAYSWARERVEQNRWPNPDPPRWVADRIAAGDTTCAANMALRGQNPDLLEIIRTHPYYTLVDEDFRLDFPRGGADLAPRTFVRDITAKVFIAGAWQDEQTGGRWATLLDEFRPGVLMRAYGQNGTHVDALSPRVLHAMWEFLDLYVARRTPRMPATLRALAPQLWEIITGVPGLQMPPDRFTGRSYAEARRAYEREPRIRILWENGGTAGPVPGAPVATAETRHRSWPVPGTRATPWYLHAGGRLSSRPPRSARGADRYRSDPSVRPRTSRTGGGADVWRHDAAYQWTPVVDGASLAYVSEPLPRAVTMIGTGSVDLWLRSEAADTDLQVTLSEVRPDGQERYVQSGWLRASHRTLDRKRSSALEPVHTHLEADASPLPRGRFVRVRVLLFPFAHQFRAGTRIRLTVSAPGGDRPEWTFGTLEGTPVNTVGRHAGRASRVVLPVVRAPVRGLPDAPAPCPSLRAQPCRAYVAQAGSG